MKTLFTRKNIFRFFFLLAILVLSRFLFFYLKEKIRIANLQDTASPNIHTLEDFCYIKSLDRKRTIWVYLPPGHDQDTLGYPVLYLFDGDNVFNEIISGGNEWEVDEVIDESIAAGGRGCIVVAIADAEENRNTEYKPFNPETNEDADGKKLLDYMAYELKPIIDAKYNTLPDPENTAIAGCSLGGIMALYGFTKYQDTYGRAGLFSPSLWVSERFYQIVENIKTWENRRVYISVGDSEGFMDDDAKKLHQKFLDSGIPPNQLKISIEEGFGHYHLNWRQGFRKGYAWLME